MSSNALNNSSCTEIDNANTIDLKNFNLELEKLNAKRRRSLTPSNKIESPASQSEIAHQLRNTISDLEEQIVGLKWKYSFMETEEQMLKIALDKKTKRYCAIIKICTRHKQTIADKNEEILELISSMAAVKRENLKLIIELAKHHETHTNNTPLAPSNRELDSLLDTQEDLIKLEDYDIDCLETDGAEQEHREEVAGAVNDSKNNRQENNYRKHSDSFLSRLKKNVSTTIEQKRLDVENKLDARRIAIKKNRREQHWNATKGLAIAIRNTHIVSFPEETFFR